MPDREDAWFAVHEALPPFRRVGPVTYDPGVVRPDGLMGAFCVTARGPHPGRGKMPVTVSGTGEDEVAALRNLDERLRGRHDSGGALEALRQRVRLAYVSGAEGWTQFQQSIPGPVEQVDVVGARVGGGSWRRYPEP